MDSTKCWKYSHEVLLHVEMIPESINIKGVLLDSDVVVEKNTEEH